MRANQYANYGRSIQGILLDVDGTLYHQFPVRLLTLWSCFRRHFKQLAHFCRSLKIIYIFRQALEELRSQEEKTDIRTRQIAYTAQKSGETKEVIERVVEEYMFKRPLPYLKPFRRKGMLKFIKAAHASGFAIGVISDYPCKEKLKHLGIDRYVSSTVSSYDTNVGELKPALRSFLLSSNNLNVAPKNILYIGDRVDTDGAGAVRCGMRFLLIGSPLKAINHYPEISRVASFNKLHRELFQ